MKQFKAVALTFFAILAGAFFAQFSEAGQNFAQYIAQQLNTGSATYLQTDAQGALLTAEGASTALDVSASSVIQVGAGRVASVSVLTASGVAGTVYDSATLGAASSVNAIAVIPATVGVTKINMPFTNGLVYAPGTAQTASISYNK